MITEKTKPSIIADQLGLAYANRSEDDHKKIFGQYMTPVDVADFMAGLASIGKLNPLRILDPGIGSGILAISLIERIIEKFKTVNDIHLVGYEIDSGLMPINKEAMEQLKI